MRRPCEFLGSAFLLAVMTHPLSVTFQRAFGFSRDLNDSLDAVVKTDDQGEYPLRAVSPQLPTLSLWLVRRAGTATERFVIVPGGGSNATNVAQTIRKSAACEIQTSLSGVRLASYQGQRLAIGP
jgi:copper homeostasis protein CutC